MDHSRSVILFQSTGPVHVLERDVDGLWVSLIAGNQSVVVSVLIDVTVSSCERMKNKQIHRNSCILSVNVVFGVEINID